MNEEHEGNPVSGAVPSPSVSDLIELLCAEVFLDQRLIMAIPGPETPKDVVEALRASMLQGELRRQRIKASIESMLNRSPIESHEESELEQILKKVAVRWPYVAAQSRKFFEASELTEERKVVVMRRYLKASPTLDVARTLGKLAEKIAAETMEVG